MSSRCGAGCPWFFDPSTLLAEQPALIQARWPPHTCCTAGRAGGAGGPNCAPQYALTTHKPHLSLNRVQGERVALVGPNGEGKSTLVTTLVGDLAPLAGTVQTHGWVHREGATLPPDTGACRRCRGGNVDHGSLLLATTCCSTERKHRLAAAGMHGPAPHSVQLSRPSWLWASAHHGPRFNTDVSCRRPSPPRPRSSARVAMFKQTQVEEMRSLPDATALSYMQVQAPAVVLQCLVPCGLQVCSSALCNLLYCTACQAVGSYLASMAARLDLCTAPARSFCPVLSFCSFCPAQERWPSEREQALRNHLGSFGIKGALATQPLSTLSGAPAHPSFWCWWG